MGVNIRMNPAISIVIPVYNLESYLRTCLNSILAQTFTNFEVIVVNDGSSDKSGEICEEYRVKDHRIKVIQQEYGGVSSARNNGLKAAHGQYIGFVDGDDRIDPTMYKRLYELCVDTKSDISICTLGREIKGNIITEVKKEIIQEMDNEEALSELFKGELYRFSLCNKLFKRSCFNNITFPEGRIHEDLSTTYLLFANANKIVFNNFIGYIYIKRTNSILTSQYSEKRLDSFEGWNEIISFMKENYPQLVNEVLSVFSYWCIDNMYYILNQVEDRTKKREYLKTIRKNVNRNYKSILKSDPLSPKYKFIISMINFKLEQLLIINKPIKMLRRVT